jgi:hypothetical protein
MHAGFLFVEILYVDAEPAERKKGRKEERKGGFHQPATLLAVLCAPLPPTAPKIVIPLSLLSSKNEVDISSLPYIARRL